MDTDYRKDCVIPASYFLGEQARASDGDQTDDREAGGVGTLRSSRREDAVPGAVEEGNDLALKRETRPCATRTKIRGRQIRLLA